MLQEPVDADGIATPSTRIINFDPLPEYVEPEEPVVLLEVRGAVRVVHGDVRHSRQELRINNVRFES